MIILKTYFNKAIKRKEHRVHVIGKHANRVQKPLSNLLGLY